MALKEEKVDYDLLDEINRLRATLFGQLDGNSEQQARLDKLEAQANDKYDASSYFLVYGSLGPGGPNLFRVADIPGSKWMEGFSVRGDLNQEGWGAALVSQDSFGRGMDLK